jgi:catechol 2,3-dioxygenase-like lactoylglutathione lyase family enzyme
MPSATVMGHIHLKVAGIAETIGFYRDVLGFALMAQRGPHAAFLSAGPARPAERDGTRDPRSLRQLAGARDRR